MHVFDNINSLFGDNLKAKLAPRAKVSIAAANFSIFAYEALRAELQNIEALEFIFTSPTFTNGKQTEDAGRRIASLKSRRETANRDLAVQSLRYI